MDDWWWMMDDGWWMMMMDDEDDDDDEEEEEDKDDGDDGDDEWSLYDHFNNSNKEVPIMWWNKWASSSMTTARSEPTKLQVKNGWKGCLFHVILLMEEILHHLRYIKIIKPCKSWDRFSKINWWVCRNSEPSTNMFQASPMGIFRRTSEMLFYTPQWIFTGRLGRMGYWLHKSYPPQKFHELITNNSHSLKPETHLFQGPFILAKKKNRKGWEPQ